MNPIHVLVTMDVEPVKKDPNWTGPEDARTSERLIRAYADAAGRFGFPVSFFAHPEAAELHARLLLDLEERGHCIGLHLHPTRFSYPRYRHELGFYSAVQQRETIGEAMRLWRSALGRDPLYFRPGAFSANDATFPTLVDLGFRGGSVSIPGRVWPERYCIWAGAEPDPHRAHATFRQLPGDLPFANIPLSVDTRSTVQAGATTYYRDLRPSGRGAPAAVTLRNILEELCERRPPVPVLHFVTHNDQPFDDPSSPSSRYLAEVLGGVGALCRSLGTEALPSTVARVCDKVLALPPEAAAAWDRPNDVTM